MNKLKVQPDALTNNNGLFFDMSFLFQTSCYTCQGVSIQLSRAIYLWITIIIAVLLQSIVHN